jgi:arylsulfatase A-like enzyme
VGLYALLTSKLGTVRIVARRLVAPNEGPFARLAAAGAAREADRATAVALKAGSESKRDLPGAGSRTAVRDAGRRGTRFASESAAKTRRLVEASRALPMDPRLSRLLLFALAYVLLAAPPAAGAKPSIVLILTDDQRWDTVTNVMPTVEQELGGHGVTFTNAFAVNPLCCPSRATILTGRYSHSTRVYGNAPPYGGAAWFDDSSTIATWLHDAGYRTAYLGKYLNGYGGVVALPGIDHWYVPPGWDRWSGYTGGYLDYHVSVDGLTMLAGVDDASYSTDVFAREAVSFIESSGDRPFFLVYAPYAPHATVRLPKRDRTAFEGIPPWRPPSFNEEDVSDKPSWVQARPPLDGEEIARVDEFRRKQLAAQLAVDDGVASIVGTLRASGRLENTMVVFLSDNGILWGEHRLWNRKQSAFEESIRLPLVIRYDPLVDAPRSNDRLVANVDLAPTFADLAGIDAPGAEGRSLVPLLDAASADPPEWRTGLLIEHLQGAEDAALEVPTYCAVRKATWKYVAYADGEEELYDLADDPYELANRASDSAYRTRLLELRAQLKRLCSPAPPGLDLAWLCTVEASKQGGSTIGSTGPDTVCGRSASDVIEGRGGADDLRGNAGDDRLLGGLGGDRLDGGPGRDLLDGGPGDDIVLARDGLRDRVVCGPGLDVVYADKRDRVARSCEQVSRLT